MGVYRRAEERAHSYPLYTKTEEGETHCLYRATDDGRWRATDDEKNIAKNRASIESKSAADLPMIEGLKWKFVPATGRKSDDPAIACTAVRGTMGLKHRPLADPLLTRTHNVTLTRARSTPARAGRGGRAGLGCGVGWYSPRRKVSTWPYILSFARDVRQK